MREIRIGTVFSFTYKTPVARRVGKLVEIKGDTILVDHGNKVFRRYHSRFVGGVRIVPMWKRFVDYVTESRVYGKHSFTGV